MDTQEMIKDYFASGGVITNCPPASAMNNEQARATSEEVAKLRRLWRKKNKVNKK